MRREPPIANMTSPATDSATPPATPPQWKPSLLMKASMAWVACALLMMLWKPEWWGWAVVMFGGAHIVLTVIGLWPRSTLLGPNLLRLPAPAIQRGEIALTIDDGPDPEVTPQVLEILDQYGAKATFFCIGELAERHPGLCRDIMRRGHGIENHSYHHNPLFSLFTPRKMRHEISLAQSAITGITGYTPRFFRPCAGLRNPLLDWVLSQTGLRLVSWSKRGFDTRETDPGKVLGRLLNDLKGGDILLLHDGNAAKTARGVPVILEVLPPLLECLQQRNLRTVTLQDAAT